MHRKFDSPPGSGSSRNRVTRASSFSPASKACAAANFRTRHVTELVAAPFDSNGVAVVAVIRLADQRQAVTDLDIAPGGGSRVILTAGERRVLDENADRFRRASGP